MLALFSPFFYNTFFKFNKSVEQKPIAEEEEESVKQKPPASMGEKLAMKEVGS